MSGREEMRIVVTRGDRYDVAEWTPGERTWFGEAPAPLYEASSRPLWIGLLISIVVVAAAVFAARGSAPPPSKPLVDTVADLQAVHAGVTARGASVRRGERLAAGDAVETDADGRGRIRLDDGTVIIVDRKTRLTASAGGIALSAGRVFVQGAPGAHTALDLGGGTAVISGADAGVAREGDRATVYVARAEITVRAPDGAETTVRAGDTATIAGGKIAVAPERGYDDWTGGMAAPWAARGERAPARAVGELWGRTDADEGGAPLTIRAHEIHATIAREFAQTEARTTFFNGGSATVTGDYRLAIPPGAIVSRFAVVRGEQVNEGRVALAARRGRASSGGDMLEWAGDGWVRGTIRGVAPGQAVTVIVGYAEWLSPRPREGGRNLVVEYRYPMTGEGAPPLVGELFARIDAGPSRPLSLAAGLGARVDGSAVELRRPDFRPTADLVVDVEIPPWSQATEGAAVTPARLYTAEPTGDEETGTVLVRTELPVPAASAAGVTLAIVMDTSASIDPALLDAERAVVEAVVGGLSDRDRVVVIAADQAPRAVGPSAVGPADEARRKAIIAALASVAPGGATDLGRALEAGADALPADAPAGMVLYVGDGWPTVGDEGVDPIKARLSRRKGGAPRLGAVAVGPLANRFGLAALTRGSGPLLEVADAADAARAAVDLLAEALRPTIAGVELDLGPEIERVYPRGSRAEAAGDTVAASGRFRGDLPRAVTLRWRDGAGIHEERRPVLLQVRGASEADVARRWAAARVEEIALAGRGREAATDVALRAGLVTPWTGFVGSRVDVYQPSRLDTRILDLAVGDDAGFAAAFATRAAFGTLTGVIHETEDDGAADDKEDAIKGPAAVAAGRVIDAAAPAVRACRDSRAALRPELSGSLSVALEIDGDGRAISAKVKGSAGADDDALDRCVEGVLLGLAFPGSGLKMKIAVSHVIDLPPPRLTQRGRRCSPTATLPMPLRRGVWRERLDRQRAADVYLEAKHACELPVWTDKRALLELILIQIDDGLGRVAVARDLDRAGEADAAALIRREAVRRARGADELRAVRAALLGDERYPVGLFKKQYGAAADDAGRLAVVRRYLSLAPHDTRLRRRLFALLEARGMKAELSDAVRLVRGDPFADAGLLADGASALRRIGDEAEARRAFGELCERAPGDPWARAFLGDRLRNEGWFDDAAAAYTALSSLVPGDPAASIRLALAQAGAGRVDIAARTLTRVAQTGGRRGDARLGDLAARLGLDVIAAARIKPGLSAGALDLLTRASLAIPRPAGATIFLVHAPAGASRIEPVLVRGPKDAREERLPEVAAEGIGVYAFRLDPGDGTDALLRLRRPAALAPSQPTRVRIDALVPDGEGKPPRFVTTEADLPISGKAVEIPWTGSAFGG